MRKTANTSQYRYFSTRVAKSSGVECRTLPFEVQDLIAEMTSSPATLKATLEKSSRVQALDCESFRGSIWRAIV